MTSKDLGLVTAYAYAVSHGYTGTEEEFAELMASHATVAEEAAESAAEAAASATAAGASETNAASSAASAGQSATSAGNSATSASGSAVQAQSSATAAGQSATQAAGSATAAGNSATAAAGSASQAAASETAAGASATAAAGSATSASGSATAAAGSATEADASADRAQEILDSIPEDYSELSDDVADLKSAISDAYGNEIQSKDLLNEINTIEQITDQYFTEVATDTTDSLTWTDGYYYDLTTGELKSSNNGYSYTQKIACSKGDVITAPTNTGQVLLWNGSSYIGYVATSPSAVTQIVIDNATYYAMNNRVVSDRQNSVEHKHTEKQLIETTYVAPAKLIYDDTYFVNEVYAGTSNGKKYTGQSYSAYYCAFQIPCEANHKYRTKTQTQVVFYNSSMTFLSAFVPTLNSEGLTGQKVEMDFTTPANCAFMSINSNSSTEMVFDVGYSVCGDPLNPKNLTGKSVVCFGDSITGNYPFGDNYPYFIEQKSGAKTYDVGFGGCRMELTSDAGAAYINPYSMASLADAIVSTDANKWSTQESSAVDFGTAKRRVLIRLEILKNIDFAKVDIITIAYGTNGVGQPLDDENNPLNTYTYAGAARYAVKTLLTKYPHLRIVLMTPVYKWYSATSDDGDTHEIAGQTLLQRVNKLISVAEELKTPVIDLYHTLGINKHNYTGYFGDDDETADGTHINSFGREQMGKRVAGELIRLF